MNFVLPPTYRVRLYPIFGTLNHFRTAFYSHTSAQSAGTRFYARASQSAQPHFVENATCACCHIAMKR